MKNFNIIEMVFAVDLFGVSLTYFAYATIIVPTTVCNQPQNEAHKKRGTSTTANHTRSTLDPENRDQASPVIASFSSAICPSFPSISPRLPDGQTPAPPPEIGMQKCGQPAQTQSSRECGVVSTIAFLIAN